MQNRAGFLAVVKEGQILLVRSSTQPEHQNSWSLPGGVIEEGESFEEGAQREVLEETGITAKAKECFKTLGQDSNLLVKLFKASYISGEIKIDRSEILEAKWFDIKDLSELNLAYSLKVDLESEDLWYN